MEYIFKKTLSKKNNPVFLFEDSQGREWAGKITMSLNQDPFNVQLDDANQRALLVHRLANYLKLPTIAAKTEPISKFPIDQESFPNRIDDRVFLSSYVPDKLAEFKLQQRESLIEENIENIVGNIVLHLWVGNYDKKTDDYLVRQDNRIVSIDHQLSGPHPNYKNKCIGAYAQAFSIEKPQDTGWCVEGDGPQTDNTLSIIKYLKQREVNYSEFCAYADMVKDVQEEHINKLMDGILFDKGSLYKSFLIDRKAKLEPALRSWINNRFPVRSKQELVR